MKICVFFSSCSSSSVSPSNANESKMKKFSTRSSHRIAVENETMNFFRWVRRKAILCFFVGLMSFDRDEKKTRTNAEASSLSFSSRTETSDDKRFPTKEMRSNTSKDENFPLKVWRWRSFLCSRTFVSLPLLFSFSWIWLEICSENRMISNDLWIKSSPNPKALCNVRDAVCILSINPMRPTIIR